MHDFTTGRSATGVLHMLNQTPIGWFSKRQGQVETATYGSEFVAARIATEQIIDLRFTLRSLGVPLDGPSWMFGDNQSVITSSTIPHSQLTKRWNALSYHRVREAIASGFLRFHYIHSKQNPSDILTKALDYPTAWPHVETLLFWKGETVTAAPRDQRGVSNEPSTEPTERDGSLGQVTQAVTMINATRVKSGGNGHTIRGTNSYNLTSNGTGAMVRVGNDLAGLEHQNGHNLSSRGPMKTLQVVKLSGTHSYSC